MPRSFAYDLALGRYVQAGEKWLQEHLRGNDTHAEVDRLRRAFRREERKERKRSRPVRP